MPTEEMTKEINQAIEEMTTEVDITKENATEVNATEVDATEVNATEVDVTEVDTTKGDTTEGDTTEGDTTEGDTTEDRDNKEDTEITSAPPVISDEALMRAAEVGIPLADARAFPSEGSLISIVNRMEAAANSIIETEQEEKPEDPFANLPKLDPEIYEPEVIKMYEGMTDVLRQQQEKIQELQSRHDEISEASRSTMAREVEQWFDNQVSELGDDFSDALGVGGYMSLPRGSSQYANREAIANQMSTLLYGYQASGQQAPSREEVFDMAARLVLRDEYQEVYRKKLADKLEAQASQHIQRASGQRTADKQSVEDEVAAAIDAKYGL